MKILLLTLLFFISITQLHCQTLKEIDLANLENGLANAFEYGYDLPNYNNTSTIFLGLFNINNPEFSILEVDNQTLENSWVKKFPAESNTSIFYGNHALFHQENNSFIKFTFEEHLPSINNSSNKTFSFGTYSNNLVADNSSLKYYENTINERGYQNFGPFPPIKFHKKLNDDSYFISGNFDKIISQFSLSVRVPHIIKVDNQGSIIWSKSYELQDDGSLIVDSLEELDDINGIIAGRYRLFHPTLEAVKEPIIANINLTNGDISNIRRFRIDQDYGFAIMQNGITVFSVANNNYVTGTIHYFSGGPHPEISEFQHKSFIAKIDENLNIEWFKHYSGVILQYGINNIENEIIAVTQIPIINSNGSQAIGNIDMVVKIDLNNQGEISNVFELDNVIWDDNTIDREYEYVKKSNNLYSIGYSQYDSNTLKHHVIQTLDLNSLEGCNVNIITDQFTIFDDFNPLIAEEFTAITFNDIFINNTLEYTESDDTAIDGTLSPVEICSTTLGINDIAIQNNLNIYPNPSSGLISIDSEFNFDSYAVSNLLGKEIISNKNLINNSVNLKTLNNGVYFLTLKKDDLMIKKKIIIQK